MANNNNISNELKKMRELYAYAMMSYEYITHPKNYPDEVKKYGDLPAVDLVAKNPYFDVWGSIYDMSLADAYRSYVYSWLLKSNNLSYNSAGDKGPDNGKEPITWDHVVVKQTAHVASDSKPKQITAETARQAIAEAESTIPTNSQQVAIPATPVITAAEPAETKPSDNNKKKEPVNTENVFKNIEGVTINELNYGGSIPNVRKLKLTTDKGEFIVLADEAGEIISDTPKLIVITGENDGTPLLAIELRENSIKKWLSDPTSYRGCISKEIFNLYTKKLCDFSKGSPARKWQVQKSLTGFMKKAGPKIVAAFGKVKCDLIDKDKLTISVDATNDKICDVELSKDDKDNIIMYPNYAQFFEKSHQHGSNCSCGCNDNQQTATQPAVPQTPQMVPMNNMVSPEMLFQMMSSPEFMQAMVTAGQQIAAQAAG